MFNLKAIVFGIVLALASVSSAFAQCGTTAPANKFCGNDTGSSALATWKTVPTGALSPIPGGTVLGNITTASAPPTATSAPTLGVPGLLPGALTFRGFTSGSITIAPQAVAGAANLTLPNTSGTFAVGASSPLALSSTTGLLTCPTCVTSSGGGAITGSAPIAVSGAGVVSINAPYVALSASNGGVVYSGATNLAILAGTATARQMLQSGASTAPAWSTATWPATTTAGTMLASGSANTVTATATPVLGVAGTTVGSLGFQNATSGTITLAPVTGALGAVTVSLPAATTRLMGIDTTDTMTGKTYDTAGSGNSLLIAGVAVTANSGTGAMVRVTGAALVTPALGVATATSLALGGASIGSNALAVTGTTQLNGVETVTSNSAVAFNVGANGSTNPVFQIDASSASQATGVKVTGQIVGGGSRIETISSGTNESLSLNGKGSGIVALGNVSTGGVQLGSAGGGVTVSGALTYGGVTLNSAVTGTGNMVLSTNAVLTTPNLGTPSAINLGNATNLATTALTGTLQVAQEPAHTGDMTNTAGSLATTVTGINGVNQNAAWTAYTPTITAGGGTFTTVSATGRYKQIGKTILLQADVTITSAGSAAGNLIISLPLTAAAFTYVGTGREHNLTGKSGAAVIPASGTTAVTIDATGATFIATGNLVAIGVTYEIP